MKVFVLGTGGWGIALAMLLHQNGHEVTSWTYLQEECDLLHRERCNEKLLPVITSQMETDLSATELVSVAVSMLKISSSNIMFGQVPVYMGQAISYNGNSTVVVARQETADLLNEYFRENTGPVDASQLNIAGDDGLFDLSGLTASDPSVQFMGSLNEEISNAQQTNNIDGSATTDVYDTATPAPDDSTDGDSTDGDSTPSE